MPKRNSLNWWTRRTEIPPYEIVGPLERLDECNLVTKRAQLVPGTPPYEAYYAAHPEKLKIDGRFRFYPTKERKHWKQAAVYRKYPFAVALGFVENIGSYITNYVEEPVAPQRVVIEPRLASDNIKGTARYFGADLVGICELNPAWILSRPTRSDHLAETMEPKHRYAVVVAVAHDFNMALASRGFTRAIDIDSERRRGKSDTVVIRLASYIRHLGYPAQVSSEAVKSGAVIVQALAVDAGLGEVGRNSLLITKEFGPAVTLGVVTTDMPLEVDKPMDLGIRDFCAKCLKCAVNCPTKSIPFGDREVIRGVKLWRLDVESCYRLRMAVGDSHICGRCVSVCPWTKPRNIIHQTTANLAIYFPFTRRPLIWLDDFLYGRKPTQHPLPSWLEPGKKRSLKQRIITALHKV